MEYRRLGNTGVEVSSICLGTAFRAQEDEAICIEVVDTALHMGVNFIDTALYGNGRSEEIVGKAIAQKRDEVFLCTKIAGTMGPGPNRSGLSRLNLMRGVDDSLRRLQTDHIDIWQPHTPSVGQLEEHNIVEVMQEVKETGKIRHIGVSGTLPDNETFVKWGLFESFQIPYSALERKEENLISAVARSGAGTLIRGGVARGEPGVGVGSEERWETWERAGLNELRAEDESPTAFLLRFTITHPHVHTTIVATMNPEHLAENLQTMEMGPLAPDVYEEAKRRLAEVGQAPEEPA